MTDRLTVYFKSGNKIEFEAESWEFTPDVEGGLGEFSASGTKPRIPFIDIREIDIVTAVSVKKIGGRK